MWIDENAIDSKSMELVDGVADSIWDDIDSKITLAADLGYINGVCELAKALKEMLKEDGDGNDK